MQKNNEWLLYAKGDLELAIIGLKSENDLVIGGVLYHCQQCIEKSLKAISCISRTGNLTDA